METYLDVYLHANGEKASVIYKKLLQMGFKPTIGEHDFVYNWKRIVNLEEEIAFVDTVQVALKDTGALIRFFTMR
ncbi:MAG: hypothetical protein KKC68_04255 [Candidatus Thermoplasmatota archaeon]|nr:hypothetical protein [Candidatus Thermoplasmatota archaeon]MBU1940964.1 hypothetical protein [Candidatus Thermoplasmatota archaeon]